MIRTGVGELLIDGIRNMFQPCEIFFVGSGIEHRFENFSPDFSTWIFFWGPNGGESDRSVNS
ncbi:MAG: hypothetical protein ACRES7_04705 [Gammaproteobacteria bacterium]